MITNFYIGSDGFFRGNGIIPFLAKEVTPEDLKYENVLQEVIHDVKRLHDVYILSMIDDGKITGRERIQLCKKIDFLLGDLILLRMITGTIQREFNLVHEKYNLKLCFRCVKARWEGYGSMGTIKGLATKKMKDWIKTSYSVKLKRLLDYSSLSLKDGKLNLHEAEMISSYIEKLIIGLILARNGIYTARIS